MKLPRLRRSPARTTLLGVAALGVLIWAAITQLTIIAMLTLGLGVAAACGVLLLKLLSKICRKFLGPRD